MIWLCFDNIEKNTLPLLQYSKKNLLLLLDSWISELFVL